MFLDAWSIISITTYSRSIGEIYSLLVSPPYLSLRNNLSTVYSPAFNYSNNGSIQKISVDYCSESFHLDKGVLETLPWHQGSGVEDRIGGSNGQQDVQSRHETAGEKRCHVGLHAASEHKTRRLPKLNLGPTSEKPPNPGLARLLSTAFFRIVCLLRVGHIWVRIGTGHTMGKISHTTPAPVQTTPIWTLQPWYWFLPWLFLEHPGTTPCWFTMVITPQSVSFFKFYFVKTM